MSKLYEDRESILDTCRLMQSALTDNTMIDAELADIRSEMDVVAGLIRSCIAENSTQQMDQTSYQVRYNSYVDRYEKLKERYADLQKQHEDREEKAIHIGGFMFELYEMEELPITFDERLWNAMVDHVVVYENERLVFHFKNGAEVTVQM